VRVQLGSTKRARMGSHGSAWTDERGAAAARGSDGARTLAWGDHAAMATRGGIAHVTPSVLCPKQTTKPCHEHHVYVIMHVME